VRNITASADQGCQLMQLFHNCTLRQSQVYHCDRRERSRL